MFTYKKMLRTFTMLFLSLASVAVYADATDALLRSNSPTAGNRNAPITIVEFFDYQCSHCITMTPVMDNILRSNSDVRIVYKDFPIRGPMSDLAARAAIAANKQGKYQIFSHGVMALKQPLTEDAIMDVAKRSNLNMNQFKKDLNSKATMNQIKANYDLAANLKISGTPAFYFGKTKARSVNELIYVLGEMNQQTAQKNIDTIRKQ